MTPVIITHSAGLFVDGEQFEPLWMNVTGVTPNTYTLTVVRQIAPAPVFAPKPKPKPKTKRSKRHEASSKRRSRRR